MRKLDFGRLESRITSRIKDDLEHHRVGGVLVSVRQEDHIYRASFGTKDMKQEPLGYDTLFRLASMTKPITAAAVMALVDEGRLRLEDRVADYLPDYAQMSIGRINGRDQIEITGPAHTPLTVLHLLTHTSGIGSAELGVKQWIETKPEDRRTLRDCVDYYAGQSLAFEPYTQQAYSATVALDVAARIVELVSGESYDRFLQTRLFDPLDMKDTTFAPTETQWSRMIAMHNRADEKGVVCPMPEGCVFEDFPTTYFCGGAGLAATLEDYEKFAQMLLHEGLGLNGNRVLSREAVRQMRTPHVPAAIMPPPVVWGLGMRVITDETYRDLPAGCFGWSGAYGTHFWVDPANRITAVYMKNSRYDGGAGAVTAQHFEQDVTASFA